MGLCNLEHRALKYISFISAAVYLFVFSGCNKDGPTEPQPTKPQGYQEDIPWPSLADSPWPMYRADPQNTGRSKFAGPDAYNNKIVFEDYEITSGVAVSRDSLILFVSSAENSGLFAHKYSGEKKWEYLLPLAHESSTPLILSDGSIFITYPRFDKLKVFDKNGLFKWDASLNESGGIMMSPLKNGNLIAGKTEGLYCVDQNNGSVIWQTANSNFLPKWHGLSPDGKTLFVPGKGDLFPVPAPALYAVDVNTQSIKWTYGNKFSWAPPMIDADNRVYLVYAYPDTSVHPYEFYSEIVCLSGEGEKLWLRTERLNENRQHLAPTIDKWGNIYYGCDSLYSVDYNGNLRWKSALPNPVTSHLICDIEGNVYFTTGNSRDNNFSQIMAFNKAGGILWQTSFDTYSREPLNLAIGHNKKLVVSSYRGNSINIIH